MSSLSHSFAIYYIHTHICISDSTTSSLQHGFSDFSRFKRFMTRFDYLLFHATVVFLYLFHDLYCQGGKATANFGGVHNPVC